jgi:hypothetical protein
MKHLELKKYLPGNDYETETCSLGRKWWYVKNLVKAAESEGLEVFDIDVASIDLGVMPWDMKSFLHFIEHMIDIKNCSLKYPVTMAPCGWIMNGWHRVVKAFLKGEPTIKAVRFFELPKPDGLKDQEDAQD